MKTGIKTIAAAAMAAIMIAGSTGCSVTGSKAIEQGKLSMAGADYKTALNMFNLAKSEGAKDRDLDEMVSILEAYIEAKDAYNADNIDGANSALEKMPETYVEYTIKSDVDALTENIAKKQVAMGDVDSQIAGLRKMIAYGDYDSAGYNIDELKTKTLTEYQSALM